MNFSDDFFKRVEKKTKVDKKMIVSLAEKLNKNGMKDEDTIREVIDVLSNATGRKITKEQQDKIISKVVKNDIPDNMDKMF